MSSYGQRTQSSKEFRYGWAQPDGTPWVDLGVEHGAQPAPYQKATLKPSLDVHCQGCGKRETKARVLILTRSSLVCQKCYDETKHGETSTQSTFLR